MQMQPAVIQIGNSQQIKQSAPGSSKRFGGLYVRAIGGGAVSCMHNAERLSIPASFGAVGLPNGPSGVSREKCLSPGEVGRCLYVFETVASVLCVDMQSLLFFGMPSEH